MNFAHAEVATLDPTTMRTLCEEYMANNYIDPETSARLGVKRGLRTPDGTGVRDYIHVCDLASGHVAALNWMNGKTGVEIFNLGTGTGTSVLEVVAAFSKACGKELPYVIRERRAGDIAANWCDASKAERMMGWKAQYDIADMCRDSWNWQSHNPNGFADAE